MQNVVVPWSIIDGPESAAAFAKMLRAAPRLADGPNAIGSAIAAAPTFYGRRALKNAPTASIAACASGSTAALPCQPWIMSSQGW